MRAVQELDQGFTLIKFVNTNVDDKNILFDNYSHDVKIFCAAMLVQECVMCLSIDH